MAQCGTGNQELRLSNGIVGRNLFPFTLLTLGTPRTSAASVKSVVKQLATARKTRAPGVWPNFPRKMATKSWEGRKEEEEDRRAAGEQSRCGRRPQLLRTWSRIFHSLLCTPPAKVSSPKIYAVLIGYCRHCWEQA